MDYDLDSQESRISRAVDRLTAAIHPNQEEADPCLLPANPKLICPNDFRQTAQNLQNFLWQMNPFYLHPLLDELEKETNPKALIDRLENTLEAVMNPDSVGGE